MTNKEVPIPAPQATNGKITDHQHTICLMCIVASIKLSCVQLFLVGRVHCCSCLGCVLLCVFVVLCVHCCLFTLDAGLLPISQYSEGPANGHLDIVFSWFPCV